MFNNRGGVGGKSWFVTVVDFQGVNSLTMADFSVNNGFLPAGLSYLQLRTTDGVAWARGTSRHFLIPTSLHKAPSPEPEGGQAVSQLYLYPGCQLYPYCQFSRGTSMPIPGG